MLDVTTAGSGGPTRVEAVMGVIQARIDSRSLAPGARLPSVRDLAVKLSVSKSTVVEAYDRLVAQGAIAARRGSGFYVAGLTRPLSLKAIAPRLDRAIDPLWLTRQSLDAGSAILKPGSGWLPSAWMPTDAMRRGLRRLAREPGSAALCHYDTALGFAPLRRQLAHRLTERGIGVGPEQIVLTDSASHALDLLCRFLLEPGDTVLVDDPCYFNFHALLRAQRAKVVGVRFGRDGPDLDLFEQALTAFKPRFYLTNAGLHNPTGVTIPAAKAHRLLALAERHDTLIIEDDVFVDLESEATARLAAFDGLDRVIQVGSFSKTMSQASRCGYVALKSPWVEPLVDLKLSTSLGHGHLSAALVHHMLTDGSYRRHMDGLRVKLSAAMGETIRRLGALGLEPFVTPQAGLFLWMRLPGGLDAADVARRALKKDVILAPGNVFSASHTASGFLRFNVGRCGEPRVYDVLAEAMDEALTAR